MGSPPHSAASLYAHSILGVSLFFWTWAFQNSIAMAPPNIDFGLVSFGTTALTSTYLLGVLNHHKKHNPHAPLSLSTTTRVLLPASQILVALNYALGAYLGATVMHRPGFTIYCVIFSLLWVGATIIGTQLLGRTGSTSPNSTDEASTLL